MELRPRGAPGLPPAAAGRTPQTLAFKTAAMMAGLTL
jgi:hypothetical protein